MNKLVLPGLAAACAALAGCSSPPPPQVFPPLDYSYLPPLVLKVASVNVVNNYVPSPEAARLIGEDPAPPAIVLQNTLDRRMVASGAPGSGTVTIQNASIDEVGGNLVGAMTVDVNVSGPGGSGFVEASVTATETAPNPDASFNAQQAALYDLTKRLMTNMNVQLQYQLEHHLGTWLSWSGATGAAPAAAGPASDTGNGVIQATPLSAPGAPDTGAPQATVPEGSHVNPAVPQYLPGAAPTPLTPPPAQ
jgi:hypothetical protein